MQLYKWALVVVFIQIFLLNHTVHIHTHTYTIMVYPQWGSEVSFNTDLLVTLSPCHLLDIAQKSSSCWVSQQYSHVSTHPQVHTLSDSLCAWLHMIFTSRLCRAIQREKEGERGGGKDDDRFLLYVHSVCFFHPLAWDLWSLLFRKIKIDFSHNFSLLVS